MEAVVYQNLRLEKSVKRVVKSSLIEKKQIFGSIVSNCISGSKDIFHNFISVFSFCRAKIVILEKIEFFYVFRLGIVVCFKYRWISVLRYLYAIGKVLGFCGWNFFVVNLVNLDFWQPQVSIIWTLVSIILWSSTLSNMFVWTFYSSEKLCFFTCSLPSRHFANRNRAAWISYYAIFMISRIWWLVFRVLWRPRSRLESS